MQSLEQRIAHLERQWEEMENGLALLAEVPARESDALQPRRLSSDPYAQATSPGGRSDEFRRYATGMLVAMEYARYMADREAESTPPVATE